MKRMLSLAVMLSVLALAGCGGSSDHTSQAATCLKNAIANAAGGGGPGNCADSSAADQIASGTLPAVSGPLQVSCTHQNGDQYVCDVNGGFSDDDGFYAVSYDGKSITYQAQ